jgi:hypothetical protein
MLRRMLEMQLDESGPSDLRCLRTANKITNLLNQESEVDGAADTVEADPHEIPAVDGKPGTKNKRKNVLKAFKSMIKKK